MLKIEYKKIEDLINYVNNSRTHSTEQINQICSSINEFGFTNPILIDDKNEIIAGHGRLQAAKKLKLLEVPCIVLQNLTKAQKKAYVIADNKLALNAGWDEDLLKLEIKDLKELDFNLDLLGFSKDELKLFDDKQINDGLNGDEDEIPEEPKNIVSVKGDVWLLGNHRLMCGDSTLIDDVDKLMNGKKADMVFTDPPYNTGMTEKQSDSTWLNHMFNDSFTPEEWEKFMSDFCSMYYTIMKDDTVAYICLDWRRNHELVPHIKKHFKLSNIIIWDKVVHGLGSDYKYTYELINVCKKGKPSMDTHQGDREYQDVWHIQRKMGKDEEHATKKPIELVERALKHASIPGDLIVDLFGGSGSTLVACEKHNRKCFSMELETKYIDIIINRWQKLTGKKAILESTGELFDDLYKKKYN